MYTFKIYEEFTKEDKKKFLNHSHYAIFMENEKIVLGLFKEKCHEGFQKHFEKDYIVLGELNLEEMENYSYECFSHIRTITFETDKIFEILTSLKPLFPLYVENDFKEIKNELFFLFNIGPDIVTFLNESLRKKYHVDFSVFGLKGLEAYDITNIFTYWVDCCAGMSEYLRFQFGRYTNESITEETASKALLDLLNKELVEGNDEPLGEDINFPLKRIEGFTSLYDVFKECYVSYLRHRDKDILSSKGYNPYNYEERFRVITDSNKHETFVLDLEKVLREINILENIKGTDELIVFNYKENVDTDYELYKNTFVCFYNNFIIVFANILDY